MSGACYACGGEGSYHDCGEDCCACLEPDLCRRVECGECDGTGRLYDGMEPDYGDDEDDPCCPTCGLEVSRSRPICPDCDPERYEGDE